MDGATHLPVVLGYDDSECSLAALRFAVAEARLLGATLRVVHAVPSGTSFTDLPEVAEQLEADHRVVVRAARGHLDRLAPDLVAAIVTGHGAPAEVLVAESVHAAAVVLGRDAGGVFRRLFGGTTTEAVARASRVPVYVVPHTWHAEDAATGRVLVGLREPAGADLVLRSAFEQATLRRAAVRVVHAWRMPNWYDDRIEGRTHAEAWAASAHQMIDAAVAPWRESFPTVPVEVVVRHDDPARALVESSAEADVLLVQRRAFPLLGAHLGHVGRKVVDGAMCPVVVVPSLESAAPPLDLELEQAGHLVR